MHCRDNAGVDASAAGGADAGAGKLDHHAKLASHVGATGRRIPVLVRTGHLLDTTMTGKLNGRQKRRQPLGRVARLPHGGGCQRTALGMPRRPRVRGRGGLHIRAPSGGLGGGDAGKLVQTRREDTGEGRPGRPHHGRRPAAPIEVFLGPGDAPASSAPFRLSQWCQRRFYYPQVSQPAVSITPGLLDGSQSFAHGMGSRFFFFVASVFGCAVTRTQGARIRAACRLAESCANANTDGRMDGHGAGFAGAGNG